MRKAMQLSAAAALLAVGLVAQSSVTVAAPVGGIGPLAPAQATPTPLLEQIQYRRHHRGRGIGWGVGAGIAGGIVAGALLAPRYYGPRYSYDRPYYGARTYYYAAPPPAVVYEDGPGDDAVDYCMRRFRSYDPRSGTYLGYDGHRHPCP